MGAKHDGKEKDEGNTRKQQVTEDNTINARLITETNIFCTSMTSRTKTIAQLKHVYTTLLARLPYTLKPITFELLCKCIIEF